MELADSFLAKLCEIAPLFACEEGFSQYEDRVGDLSPTAHSDFANLCRDTLTAIKSCDLKTFDHRLCADVVTDFCNKVIDEYENDDWCRTINVITNPLDTIHATCHNINEEDADALARREKKIATIPQALDSFRETLRYGVEHNCLPRKTQLVQIAQGCPTYATDPLFVDTPAQAAYADFEKFLVKEIIPHALEKDAVGKEHYARSAARHLGKSVNVEETYAWGWDQIHSLFAELEKVTQELNPGGTYEQTLEQLANDRTRTAHSAEELRMFLQNQLDESVKQLDGKHFDIDPRLRTIEACLIENAGSSAMYYATPSDDFSRPGRTYYPVNDRTVFPLWEEVTTCYHEGLPGHHLHMGTVKCLGDKLSTFQKTLAWNTGETEGWALYAERLMVELGFNNDPAYIFGMLNASLFRATRVVMDIGLHCEFKIPDDAPQGYPAGRVWNQEIAVDILKNVIGLNDTFARDEVFRYLGWIGQAISYKMGEKIIRDLREKQKEELGDAFSLKAFHSQLLGYGHVGLGLLEKLFEEQSA